MGLADFGFVRGNTWSEVITFLLGTPGYLGFAEAFQLHIGKSTTDMVRIGWCGSHRGLVIE